MKENAIIRLANKQDIRELVRMAGMLLQEESISYDDMLYVDWYQQFGEEHFIKVLENTNSICYVAENQDGRAIGYIEAWISKGRKILPNDRIVITSIFIDNLHRSKGIGSKLIEETISWAAIKNIDHVEVTAYWANKKVIQFYKKRKFKISTITLSRIIKG